MKTIIIGGGKIGYYLFKTLIGEHRNAVLVEIDKFTCEWIADEINADVICGDGTDPDVLKDAGIEDANTIIAVTGTDEENLVICEIAKHTYQVSKAIARINNPKNIETFKALGIDRTVCSTEVIAGLIEYESDDEDFEVIQTLERGSLLMVEIGIGSDNVWRGKTIRDLELPPECVIVSILRGDSIIYAKGDTQILLGDKVLLITNREVLYRLKKHIRNSEGQQNEW